MRIERDEKTRIAAPIDEFKERDACGIDEISEKLGKRALSAN